MTDEPRIAVVGAGLIGRRHAALLAARGRLRGIVDPDPKAGAVAAGLEVPHHEELAACLDAGIDGAVIATPNRLHVPQAALCIARGVPVLVEKPLADSVAAARRLAEAAEAAGVAVLVGHHRRHNPIIAAARAAIAGGELGRLTLVDAQFWIRKPDDYFDAAWRRAPGAGPILINMVHDVDLMRHLCGEIERVTARRSSAVRGYAVEDAAVVLAEFVSGALGTISISDATVAPWSWEFTSGENPDYPNVGASCYRIGGTHGALSVPDLTLWSQPEGRHWWKPMARRRIEIARADPLARQLDHFADVIRGMTAPVVDARDGLRTLAVLEAIARAAEGGETVRPDDVLKGA